MDHSNPNENATSAIIPGVVPGSTDYCLSIDSRIYSAEAVKKAAYRFADRVSVLINHASESTLAVTFSFPPQHSVQQRERIIFDFCGELLDQDLRELIKKETAPLRNLLLAHAFSRTKLIAGNE